MCYEYMKDMTMYTYVKKSMNKDKNDHVQIFYNHENVPNIPYHLERSVVTDSWI